MTGTVYLVGAGPGAPDLLTLRAARLLEQADVVFHDALLHPGTLALARRAAVISVGKRCGRRATAQRSIERRLVDAARRHRVVVRLKGGDPMLFGRAQEEIDALRAAGIRFEVVPGVTAAFAASAALAVPLTRRGVARSLTLATPRVGAGQCAGDWAAGVLAADTAALYMAGRCAREAASELIARGADPETPVAVVENASLPGQRAFAARLCDLARAGFEVSGGPAVAILGAALEGVLHTRAPAASRLRDEDARVGLAPASSA